MSGEPGDDELAAIAAAYAILARARPPANAAPPSRWRLAGRVEPAGVPPTRGNGRRSAWRTAAGP